MSQAYSDPKRESDPHALPDIEVWWSHYHECPNCERTIVVERSGDVYCGICSDCEPTFEFMEPLGSGYFWWSCCPGCLPDGDPVGPFATEAEALADAREGMED